MNCCEFKEARTTFGAFIYLPKSSTFYGEHFVDVYPQDQDSKHKVCHVRVSTLIAKIILRMNGISYLVVNKSTIYGQQHASRIKSATECNIQILPKTSFQHIGYSSHKPETYLCALTLVQANEWQNLGRQESFLHGVHKSSFLVPRWMD